MTEQTLKSIETKVPFGLYIHWPFCKKKCPYCDFNSHVASHIDHDVWRKALLEELRSYKDLLGPDKRNLSSIFFGGGTPSLMEPATAAALIEAADTWFGLEEDCEITIEANPTSSEAQKFQEFAKAGVNRISIGAQSFDNRSLKFLGREHDAETAKSAILMASDAVENFSIDLIYARHDQDAATWLVELNQALALNPQHLSVYQLTIEPKTQFHARYLKGDLPVMSDDRQADLYLETTSYLEARGFQGYEISNFSKPGHECRHNLIYWRYQDYIGIGPGAHGRLTVGDSKIATQNIRQPGLYLEKVNKTGQAKEESSKLDVSDQVHETLLMGMRLSEGVPFSRLDILDPQRSWLDKAGYEKCLQHQLLEQDPLILRPTSDGRLVLNSLIAMLVS